MSPKKPVENLQTLCTKTIVIDILETIKQFGDKCVKELKQYYDQLPDSLKELLFSDILQLSLLSSCSKWIAFCIFQYKCSKFDFRKISSKFYSRFIDKLHNARYVDLTGIQIEEALLIKLIKRSPCLRVLIIPDFNITTDDDSIIFKEISKLSYLKMLDMSGNLNISPEGVKYLNNKNLEILSIGSFSTCISSSHDSSTEDVVALLLPQLPNLQELRQYEYTGKSLLSLTMPLILKLKSITDCDTTIENLEAIQCLCPNIVELILKNPSNGALKLLEDFAELKKLIIILRTDTSINNNNLSSLSKLQLCYLSLELNGLFIDLNSICLTIEFLLLTACKVFLNSSINKIRFRNLKMVEFINCIVSKSIVLSIFENCDQLERFVISSTEVGLLDDDIKKLCETQKLKHLKELWLSLAKQLTSDSVIMLMNHCDNLTLLGTLNGWNIDKVEMNYLRCVIYYTNRDLNLLYFTCF